MTWIQQGALQNRLVSGAWLSLGSAITAEIAGRSGYDWLLIDMEHGCGSDNDLMHQIQALGSSKSKVIVRVPAVELAVFKRILDMGPAGLMIPNVSTPDLARQIVDMVRVGPGSPRGIAQTTRASGYGSDYRAYLDTESKELAIVAQIESRKAVENVDEIAAIDGISVLFVGPFDLSIDLSVNPDDARFDAAIRKVAKAAAKHGKAAGILVRNSEQAKHYASMGYAFIAMGSDRGAVISSMRSNAALLAEVPFEPFHA
ncbi:MAG: 2-dehydro-3-deoxyglucarate aldolase [Castellaniella sp.]|uniref:HpcH/HpaI aldolase family protein n=1 Tax=Castellaniella sp. TaxID=1955812 RepID=UPI001219B681|nr:aldolase/citrate lyase family protein [Castellaniella sp.]TAN30034.1 MAG: 2-dehydro-3-deoxyglucarate aldolase [Castellaniella sp.]